jgi:hypothetical protein
MRSWLTQLVFFHPERAILATLCAALLVGQCIRAALPWRAGPAAASASVRTASDAPPRNALRPAGRTPRHSPDSR